MPSVEAGPGTSLWWPRKWYVTPVFPSKQLDVVLNDSEAPMMHPVSEIDQQALWPLFNPRGMGMTDAQHIRFGTQTLIDPLGLKTHQLRTERLFTVGTTPTGDAPHGGPAH